MLNSVKQALQQVKKSISRVERLAEIASAFLVIAGIVVYFCETNERQKQKHYQAWQVINSAVGREAELGRKDAIEDLWSDKVSLSGLDIHKARIPDLTLSPRCSLFQKCSPVDMNNANLEEVDLSKANLQGADLSEANLRNAHLLEKANLQEADLWGANLQGAWLFEANLQRAWLAHADLEGANLSEANLEGANLSEANLHNAIFLNTDLLNTEELVQGQLEGEKAPFICNSPVPEKFKIYQDRDCDKDELPQVLMEIRPKDFLSIKDAEDYIREARKTKIE